MRWPFIVGLVVSFALIVLCVVGGPELRSISREYSALRAREALMNGVVNVGAYNTWVDLTGGTALQQTTSEPNPDASMEDARALSANFTNYYGLERYIYRLVIAIAMLQAIVCTWALFRCKVRSAHNPLTSINV
jgi:hypothetical protein